MTALVDTHCHLAFEAFDEDREAVLDRARAAGLAAIVSVAVDAPSAEAAQALARAHPGWVFATAGIHPTEAAVADEREHARVAALLAGGGFVAVGETGLDAWHEKTSADNQRASLDRHLRLALELDLPVVLHCRDAFEAIRDALRPYRGQGLRGVLHCFTGTAEDARELVDAGLHLGLGGITTFKPRDDLRAAVREVPLERLLVETDAPWLAPVPHRGRRNEPAWVAHVAERLAADRGLPLAGFAAATTANADRLFGLGLLAAGEDPTPPPSACTPP